MKYATIEYDFNRPSNKVLKEADLGVLNVDDLA